MKKYKNTGGLVGFVMDGKTYSFQNGEIVTVDDGWMERLKSHIAKLEDISPGPIIEVKRTPVPAITEEIEEEEPRLERKWSEEELRGLEFSSLREVGTALGVKFRSKEEGIKEILEAQKK